MLQIAFFTHICNIFLVILSSVSALCLLQFCWQYWHGTILSANERRNLYGCAVSLFNRFAIQDASHERTCK